MWTTTNQGVFSGWPGTNWVADSSLPGGRPGTAAFGEDIQGGDCGGGAGDISGVMRLESPSIRLPSGVVHSYRLGFTHYIASELGWDGGNVKLSVNGGAYAVVPAGAFFFNPYNATLNSAAAGTNPLAGQPAFTGTDGGKVVGSWGTSYVDLSSWASSRATHPPALRLRDGRVHGHRRLVRRRRHRQRVQHQQGGGATARSSSVVLAREGRGGAA